MARFMAMGGAGGRYRGVGRGAIVNRHSWSAGVHPVRTLADTVNRQVGYLRSKSSSRMHPSSRAGDRNIDGWRNGLELPVHHGLNCA